MMEEIINKDFGKTSNGIKSPDAVNAVHAISNMEKIIRSKRSKSNLLQLAYQGQILEKFKAIESLIDIIKELGISKSTIKHQLQNL